MTPKDACIIARITREGSYTVDLQNCTRTELAAIRELMAEGTIRRLDYDHLRVTFIADTDNLYTGIRHETL